MTAVELSRDDFARQAGTAWRVQDGATVDLRLDEVSPRVVAGQWESFSLRFRGPAQPTLAQGIHALLHEELGQVELFLVPLQPDESGPSYEAVFNRSARAVGQEVDR